MVHTMTYPIWSGINAEQINSTEINGAAPTPLVVTEGFSSAVFPVLMGLHLGMYAEVMRARWEVRDLQVKSEPQDFELGAEKKDFSVLPENRAYSVERSRKEYP